METEKGGAKQVSRNRKGWSNQVSTQQTVSKKISSNLIEKKSTLLRTL